MKIATWNVNSIKARTEHVKNWLIKNQPDFLFLQELKGMDFPHDAFDGYTSHAVPQKAFNGVAVLARQPFDIILEKLPGDESDEQARYLEIEVLANTPPLNPPQAGGDINSPENLPPQAGGLRGERIRLIGIYLPNGNPIDTDKFPYKIKWMERLYARLKELRDNDIPFLVCGDFNVIPEERDCWDVKVWENDALYRIETRAKFRSLLNLGLTDAFRALNQNNDQYTFWDYQAGAWQKGHGIRIDHFLTSPTITDKILSCVIDKDERAKESPSDHVPVILEIRA